jgi:dipeptidyl aminopeptidase/acylaminoacyl peptidase
MLHCRLRSALTLIIAAAAVVWPAAQSAKHAITHEDVWLMKRLGTPAVSPDGKWAVLPVTEPAYNTATQSTDLWMVPTDGSAPPRRLTSTRGAESGVTWSPDGRRLAFSAPVSDGPLSPGSQNALAAQAGGPGGPSGQQIFVLDVAGGGAPARVTDVATGARMPVWRPDGKAILFNSDVHSSFHVAGPPAAPVAVAVWESAVNPPELFRIDLATGKTTPLTRFNTERAASIDWQPVKESTFTSAKGRSIHNLVVLPPAFDPAKKYPLFVVIHGGPAGQWMDQFVIRWNYHLLASPGYVVLLTNFTGSTGFGEAFAQAIQGDPLETPGQEILQAVDEALARYPFIDGSRMAAGGASYGGHLTNWLAVTTTRFKALVSHAGLYDQVSQWTTSDIAWPREVTMGGPAWEKLPLWQSQNPITKSASLKTPMLVTAGERDYRVPVNNTLQLWSILQRQRVPSRLIVFPDENHWVLKGENSRFFYDEVHAWLAKWLKAP